jgi:dimethylhistidine N-methyltransferase
MMAENALPQPSIAEEVRLGLGRTPKALPPKLLYDAEGSALFEQITTLPEYYLTRLETEILEKCADEMVARTGDSLTLVELGAGSAAKTRILIRAILRNQRTSTFYPVDVSPAPLQTVAKALPLEFEGLRVEPVVADYCNTLGWLRRLPGRKLVLYIGSSIGNLNPLAATALLADIRSALTGGDALLIGTDLAKDPAMLVPAYDDAQGVTARFNLNILARINRELAGHFDLASFRHVAEWNDRHSCMQMYLESVLAQAVPIDLLGFEARFDRGERIHTEDSYKFTAATIDSVLANAGLLLEATWTDPFQWFAVHLARVVT